MSDDETAQPGADHDSGIAEVYARHRARTEQICSDSALAARTRMLLLRIEKRNHKGGWDGPGAPPTVFQVFHKPETGAVKHDVCDGYTDIVRRIMDDNGGDCGNAVRWLAGFMEKMQAGDYDAELPPELRRTLNDFRVPGGQDIYDGPAGWSFYGFGLWSEAWMVASMDHEDREVAEARKLDRHPDRQEVRWISFAPRDGLLWWAQRIRGGDGPMAVALPPEGDDQIGGNIVHALARLTNVVAGNIRPVPERDVPTPPETNK